MSKQTAMQILIEWVDKELKLKNYEHQEIIDKATSLLPTERQQIEQAYNDGCVYGHINDSETYFATTYGDAIIEQEKVQSDEDFVRKHYPDAFFDYMDIDDNNTLYWISTNDGYLQSVDISEKFETEQAAWLSAANRIREELKQGK